MRHAHACLALGTALILAGCTSTTPQADDAFQRLATRGCQEAGQEMIVTGHVSRADNEMLVMWDGRDMNRNVTVRLPERSTGDRLRGALGTSPHERAVRQLNDLASQNLPVTATLVCRGPEVPPNALRLSYVDASGLKSEIGF